VPTVLIIGAYRFFFYSNEFGEPVHIHCHRDRAVAKFWLDPPALARSTGFSATELARIAKLVGEHRTLFEEAWNEHFGG
jgi:hypothetical protein